MLGSNLFHSLILKGKKEFRNRSVLQYKALSQPGLQWEFIIVILVHRGKLVVLLIKPYANNKVISAIFCLSKIQGLIPDTISFLRFL